MRNAALVPSLLLLAAAALPAADEPESAVGQLRLMFTHTEGYTVEQEVTGGTTYDWRDDDAGAFSGGLQYVKPLSLDARPLLWGVEVMYQRTEVTPDGYSGGFANTTDESFEYSTLTLGGVFGWRFTQPVSARIDLIGEFQVMAGVTAVGGRISDVNGSSDSGTGFGFDGSARALLGLQESGWMAAVSLGARGGYATLSLDHQTYTSDLTLDRSGLEVAVFVGMDL